LLGAPFNVDKLLNDIQKHSDLSSKTKLENSGIRYIYTRDDIERMQIYTLKDVLKNLYPIGYNENRYGLVDPFSSNCKQPYLSALIRVYIDNQEITDGLYGSGLFVLGDENLDWVDHIEIYTRAPTYAYSVESTIVLIKLYTKREERDLGGKVKVPTVAGNTVELKIPNGTQNNSKFKLKNEGMTVFNSTYKGDMFVDVNVEIPIKLNDNQKRLLKELDKENEWVMNIHLDPYDDSHIEDHHQD